MFDIPMTETLESEVQAMCNLSQGVRELGRAEGLLASIRSLMASMGWSSEQAMEALRIPSGDRPKYADLLQEQ